MKGFVQMSKVIFEIQNLPLPLVPFCWLPSGYSSSWFPIGSRWFLKNNNSGAFSGSKKGLGGVQSRPFLLKQPDIARKTRWNNLPVENHFNLEKIFFSISRCVFRAFQIIFLNGHLKIGRFSLGDHPKVSWIIWGFLMRHLLIFLIRHLLTGSCSQSNPPLHFPPSNSFVYLPPKPCTVHHATHQVHFNPSYTCTRIANYQGLHFPVYSIYMYNIVYYMYNIVYAN